MHALEFPNVYSTIRLMRIHVVRNIQVFYKTNGVRNKLETWFLNDFILFNICFDIKLFVILGSKGSHSPTLTELKVISRQRPTVSMLRVLTAIF